VHARYEKYDAPMQQDKGKSADPFSDEYQEVEAEVEKLMDVSIVVVGIEHSAFDCSAQHALAGLDSI
jgi:hypothetical protein